MTLPQNLLKSGLLAIALLTAPFSWAQDQKRTPVPDIETYLQTKGDGFSNTKAYTLPSQNDQPYRMPLTLVVNKKSRWMSAEGQARLNKDIQSTVVAYAQCGVAISPITVIETSHENLDFNDCRYDYGLTYQFPADLMPRPIAFYVTESSPCNSNYADSTTTAYSNPERAAEYGLKTVSTGSIFIEEARLDLFSDATYQVAGGFTLPHEIAHIAINQLEHIEMPGNILHHSLAGRGGSLSQNQCQAIRSSKYVQRN